MLDNIEDASSDLMDLLHDQGLLEGRDDIEIERISEEVYDVLSRRLL